ncbi:MAG: class I SAM-dependent methyltransferase [Planctomycetota bacterium]
MTGRAKPWYETAFEADYMQLYAHRDLESARREVRWLLESGVGGRTLDLCCGFGRHSLAMLERGLEVWGMDLSMDLLASHGTLDGGDALAGRLVRADMRHLPYGTGAFESVVNLFSSYGYFGEGGDHDVLEEMGRVLAPGGLLVLDLMNPERIRRELVPESHSQRDGFVMHEIRTLEDGGRRVCKQVRLVDPAGRERVWREDVRMYGQEEMRTLLAPLGLRIEAAYGDFDGSPWTEAAPRQLLFVRSR